MRGRGLGQMWPGMIPPDIASSVYSGAKVREDFYVQNAIVLPAIGAQAVVASRLIPYGRNSFLWKVGIDFVGGGFQEGAGNLIYRLFRNSALTRTIKGFANLSASMGAVNNPLEIPAVQLYESEVISIVVQNVALTVAGQLVVGVLGGWDYPKSEEVTATYP